MKNYNFLTGFTINSKFKNSNIIFLIAQFVNIVQITSQDNKKERSFG